MKELKFMAKALFDNPEKWLEMFICGLLLNNIVFLGQTII